MYVYRLLEVYTDEDGDVITLIRDSPSVEAVFKIKERLERGCKLLNVSYMIEVQKL